MVEDNEMLKIVNPMMEHVCDHLCRWPHEIVDEEEMSRICYECKMDQHICNILNTYNAACQLQVAAEIVRSELLQKGDWYNALIESIYRYLQKAGYITSWDQLARELVDQIVGIEPEQEEE